MAPITSDDIDQAVPFKEAAKFFPTTPSVYAMRRWATRGMKNGAKLRTIRICGKACTTRAWCHQFIIAANTDQDPTEPRRKARAAEKLAELGV